MIVKKAGHIHEFKEELTKKILVNSGKKTATDIIKQRKCKCGAKISYDLEREIK